MPESPATRFLCEVTVELRPGAPIALGQSPWSNRRISDIAGGRFEGPRLRGRIAPSGADWSQRGGGAGTAVRTLLDVRSLWQTDDGATLYVTYSGRLIVPAAVLAEFGDAAKVDALDPARYYFRVSPFFETAAPAYDWLNDVAAIGLGRRTSAGVVYQLFEVL